MDDSESGWMKLGKIIDGDAASELSGMSLSLSADVKQVAIGSRLNDDNKVT
jgi:hypothetical protein